MCRYFLFPDLIIIISNGTVSKLIFHRLSTHTRTHWKKIWARFLAIVNVIVRVTVTVTWTVTVTLTVAVTVTVAVAVTAGVILVIVFVFLIVIVIVVAVAVAVAIIIVAAVHAVLLLLLSFVIGGLSAVCFIYLPKFVKDVVCQLLLLYYYSFVKV